MKQFCLIICFSALTGCVSNEEKPITLPKQTTTDTLPLTKAQKSATLFNNQMPFEVVNAIKGITTASSSSDTNMCKGWTLSALQAAKVIKAAEPISGEQLHYDFLVLPCVVKGQIRQDDQLYTYKINAGSWISVTSTDTTVLYGSYKKHNQQYFLEKADDAQ